MIEAKRKLRRAKADGAADAKEAKGQTTSAIEGVDPPDDSPRVASTDAVDNTAKVGRGSKTLHKTTGNDDGDVGAKKPGRRRMMIRRPSNGVTNKSGQLQSSHGPRIGAHAVDGPGLEDEDRDFRSSLMLLDFGDNVNHSVIEPQNTPEVLDAHLAREDEAANDAPLVEAVNLQTVEDKRRVDSRREKIKIVSILSCAGLAVIVAVALGVVYGTRTDSSPSLPLTTAPTEAPTSIEFRTAVIRTFLQDDIIREQDFVPGSPHDLAVEWISVQDPLSLFVEDFNLRQRFVLVLLYFHTTNNRVRLWRRCNPPDGTEADNCFEDVEGDRWLTGSNECEWFGIFCNEDGEVISIEIESNGLRNTIPRELGALLKLRLLNFLGNSLVGTIPEEIYGLSDLRFIFFHSMINGGGLTGTISTNIGRLEDLKDVNFGNNLLTGTIPSTVGGLSKLIRIILGGNSGLSGSLPTELYGVSSLREIVLGGASLTGTLNTMIGKLGNLTHLILFNNLLSGVLPVQLGQCTRLQFLQCQGNNFVGSIPTEVGLLTDLTSLTVGGNPIEGHLASELFNLSKLLVLSIQNMELTGTIPEVGSMTRLAQFLVSGNAFSGTLPEVGSLSMLRTFQVGRNENLLGNLPESVYRLSRLTDLDISQTSLTGSISSLIGRLTDLASLASFSNNLSSTIPNEIGDCTKLTTLFLGISKIRGTIPKSIARLTDLSMLALVSTELSGSIPDDLYELTRLAVLFLLPFSGTISTLVGNLSSLATLQMLGGNLSGELPSEIGDCASLRQLTLNDNVISGKIPPELGRLQQLTELNIGGNMDITGPIPDTIYELQGLSNLVLSRTSLSGTLSTLAGQLRRATTIRLDLTRLTGSVPEEVCNRRSESLGVLSADCLPRDDPPLRCDCCSICCDRETRECEEQDA